jgi:hypothetical protein
MHGFSSINTMCRSCTPLTSISGSGFLIFAKKPKSLYSAGYSVLSITFPSPFPSRSNWPALPSLPPSYVLVLLGYLFLVAPFSCCLLLSAVVWSSQLLSTPLSCCLLLSAVVCSLQLLSAPFSCCLLLAAVVCSFQLLSTPLFFLPHSVSILLLPR